MRVPPSVRWMVGASGLHRRVVWAIALVLVILNLVCTWGTMPQAYSALAWLVSLSASLFAFYGLHKTPVGILCWTGVRWTWEGFPENAPTHVVCVLALSRFVLLKVSTATCAPVWLWIEAGTAQARWWALRRALAFVPPEDAIQEGLVVRK